MELALQLYHGGTWRDAAVVTVERPELGMDGPTRIVYEPGYFLEYGAIAFAEDKPIRDARALSVNLPVSLDTPRATWPPFVVDLPPQGFQRKKIADYLKLNPEASSTELPLLLRTGGAPVGSARIKEAFLEEAKRLRGEARTGLGDFPAEEIMDVLLAKEDLLRSLPAIARKHTIPEIVIERVMGRHLELAEAVAELRCTLRLNAGSL